MKAVEVSIWLSQKLYLGVEYGELRYFTSKGEKVASPQEEAQRADQEMRRAEQLAIKLRELGVDPDAI